MSREYFSGGREDLRGKRHLSPRHHSDASTDWFGSYHRPHIPFEDRHHPHALPPTLFHALPAEGHGRGPRRGGFPVSYSPPRMPRQHDPPHLLPLEECDGPSDHSFPSTGMPLEDLDEGRGWRRPRVSSGQHSHAIPPPPAHSFASPWTSRSFPPAQSHSRFGGLKHGESSRQHEQWGVRKEDQLRRGWERDRWERGWDREGSRFLVNVPERVRRSEREAQTSFNSFPEQTLKVVGKTFSHHTKGGFVQTGAVGRGRIRQGEHGYLATLSLPEKDLGKSTFSPSSSSSSLSSLRDSGGDSLAPPAGDEVRGSLIQGEGDSVNGSLGHKRGRSDQKCGFSVKKAKGSGHIPAGKARDGISLSIKKDEQLELAVTIVRATFCAHISSLHGHCSADPAFLPCPFQNVGDLPPPTDPLGEVLGEKARSTLSECGFRAMLQGVGDALLRIIPRKGQAGEPVEIMVSKDLLTELRNYFCLKSSNANKRKPTLKQEIIQRTAKAVCVGASALGKEKERGYAEMLLSIPWDVIAYCKKSILHRLTALVKCVSEEEESVPRGLLSSALQRLSRPSSALWYDSSQKILSLMEQLDRLQIPPVLPDSALVSCRAHAENHQIEQSPNPTAVASNETGTSVETDRRRMLKPLNDVFDKTSPTLACDDDDNACVIYSPERNLEEDTDELGSPVVSPLHSPSSRGIQQTAALGKHGKREGFYENGPSASSLAPVAACNTVSGFPAPTALPASSLASSVPRDPRKLAREKIAHRTTAVKKVDFLLPNEEDSGGHCKRTTYMRSHVFEAIRATSRQTSYSKSCPHCQSQISTLRCGKCGRCEHCSSIIFCKGAERRSRLTEIGHVNRLSERMDRAIWDAFKDVKKGFDPILALVQHAGVSVNFSRPAKGETALMAAAFHGKLATVKELLSLGADPCLKTADGHTASTFANKYNHKECAGLLAMHPVAVPAQRDGVRLGHGRQR